MQYNRLKYCSYSVCIHIQKGKYFTSLDVYVSNGTSFYITEWNRIYIVSMPYLINSGYLDYVAYTNDSYSHTDYQQHFFSPDFQILLTLANQDLGK